MHDRFLRCVFGIGMLLVAPMMSFAEAPAQSTAKLIQQGEDAFAAGNFDKACDAFADAFKAEPKNQQAARDLGIAYLRADKAAKAAHPLEVAGATKTPDRPLVMAMAFQFIAAKSPMQAVKSIAAYFNAHPTVQDESLLNAMAVALARADAMGIKSAFYTDSMKTYQKLNAKLEATRPGEKRWGDRLDAGGRRGRQTGCHHRSQGGDRERQ